MMAPRLDPALKRQCTLNALFCRKNPPGSAARAEKPPGFDTMAGCVFAPPPDRRFTG
ncbi:hypothetical protein [Paraburkholderia megapolitana]|uniref:hypothetical protein n=1 Tax=Paraburkholderia megapolitana TaxID=420953 RepID=UPI0014780DBB|nr:hypothetical protein [Paraburkholderia megapolitana]